jgi:hypothetical protein
MSVAVSAYAPADASAWDAFVRGSKNGTFLFERAYMDYHADRFVDASLMVRTARGEIAALLPAHRHGDTLASHDGLTFGGLVVDARMTTPEMLSVFAAVLAHAESQGVRRLTYKCVPHIYHTVPAEEDRYALFRAGATLARRDVLSVVEYRAERVLQERRVRSRRRAERAGVHVGRTEDLAQFWAILEENLQRRYGVAPVHSLGEMRLLAGRFPHAVELHGAFRDDVLLAGVLVYVSAHVCHVQYPGVSHDGMAVGALDLLQEHLIAAFRERVRYFDFGSSTEAAGTRLNVGLVDFKEGFGARAVMHDFYEVDVGPARERLRDV